MAVGGINPRVFNLGTKNHNRQCKYNVILKRVRVTIVVMGIRCLQCSLLSYTSLPAS